MLSHAENIRSLRDQMPRHMEELTRKIRMDEEMALLGHTLFFKNSFRIGVQKNVF